ncbi:MAG: hypothetical protein WA126_01955 [Thermodesulfovibrionales bacterium]
MKRTLVNITLVILFSFIIYKDAISWDDSATHKDLSRYAAESSVLSKDKGGYLKNLGLNKGLDDEKLECSGKKLSIKDWLSEGAELEDKSDWGFPIIPGTTTRSFNHFHNPLKDWTQAGLNDLWTGESSLLWAQDRTNQQNIVERDQTWQQARDYFYLALMSVTNSLRQENFAKMFKGLGHQMHLLQDTAVPDHVRNDAHPEDAIFGRNPLNGSAYFETWAQERFRNVNDLKSFAPNLSFPVVSFNISYNGLAPTTQLFDTDQYNGTNPSVSLTQGLAEYTNANFFSGDTIFAAERYSADNGHYFPYPKRSSTDLQSYLAGSKPEETVVAEDGDTDTGLWISKNADGENFSHIVKIGKLTKWYYNIFGEGELFYNTFYRDEKCHEDYAQKLIPRAVGYSASLLDYFFRGNIEITLPDSGVYAQTDNPATGFSQITLLAKNTTLNNEQINDGTIELVVGYRRAIDDPFLNYPEDYPFQAENEMTYIIVPEANGISSIPNNGSVELTFNLSQNPVPLWAINVFVRLIYHGRLGNEDGAVAVGFKDISEPTPIDTLNDMDRICLNGIMYTAGSAEAIDQVDTNNNGIPTWDIYPHDLSDIYFRTSPESNPQYASDTNYNVAIPYLYAGYYVRALYILTDYAFSYNYYQTLIKTVQMDPWCHLSWGTELNPGRAIRNQVEYEEEPAVCAPMSAPCHIWWYPTFLDYRDRQIWSGTGIMFINNAYPESSECSCYQGVLRNCMSGAQTLKVTNAASEDKLSQKRMEVQMQPIVDRQRRMPADR